MADVECYLITEMVEISVVIPVYNMEKYIERCACSLFCQTKEDGIEFIFVDDCSTDKSVGVLMEVLSKFPNRESQVKIIKHEHNRGLAAARYTGFENAVGKYIIHCDSDDWVEKEMYDSLLKKAKENKADIVICDYIAEYDKRSIVYRQNFEGNDKKFINQLLSGELHNSVWNKLIRRELYQYVHPLWEDGINMWEDVSLICRMSFYAKTICYLPQALYHYSQTNENAYTTIWGQKALSNILHVSNMICSFYSDKAEYSKALVYFKMRVKCTLLKHSSDTKQYIGLYPESDKSILNHPGITYYNKIIFWCQIHSMSYIGLLLERCISTVKRISR